MLSTIETINQVVNDFIWGVPAMVCIIGVGFYLSCRTGFLQIRKFSYAIQTTIGRMFRKRNASDGALTPFHYRPPCVPTIPKPLTGFVYTFGHRAAFLCADLPETGSCIELYFDIHTQIHLLVLESWGQT